MIHPRKLLDTSFRAKVLAPVVACTIGAMVIFFIIVDYRVGKQSEMEARHTLATSSMTRCANSWKRKSYPI
jgi:hypothetical protein